MLKRPLRRLTRSAGFRWVVAVVVAALIRLIYATSRWRVSGLEHPQVWWSRGRPVIGCFWHARMLLMPYPRRAYLPASMLISSHRDGLLIAKIIRFLGIETVAGSSNRRASAALRDLIAVLNRGTNVAITPDGPRGPRMRAQPGAVKLAQLSGAPIIPMAGSARRRRLLKSWDRFMIVGPFNAGVVMFGEPIVVPRDADAAMLEAKRREVEDALNTLTAEADRHCGHLPVAPAELSPADGAAVPHPVAGRGN